eukprot:gene2218-2928_t
MVAGYLKNSMEEEVMEVAMEVEEEEEEEKEVGKAAVGKVVEVVGVAEVATVVEVMEEVEVELVEVDSEGVVKEVVDREVADVVVVGMVAGMVADVVVVGMVAGMSASVKLLSHLLRLECTNRFKKMYKGKFSRAHYLSRAHQVTAKRALSTVSQRSQDHSPSFNPTLLVGSLLAASGLTATAEAEARDDSRPSAEDAQSDEVIVNWSNTHECRPKNFYQPESLQELEKIVATAHESGEKLRPIGSALSPNGLAFSNNSLVNLAFLDKVLAVDTEKRQVTVQAGARVSQVTEALRHHDVVLQNFASIAEQQIGGVPPATFCLIGLMKFVLASHASAWDAKVGLGSLGVVAEVTLQLVPAYKLVERTYVASRQFVRENHVRLLKEFVRRVNKAEAEFWKLNEGVRIDWSDRILGFECGGEQWVSEVAFPAGSLSDPNGADMMYLHELLELIEQHDLPAPSPIEQRWTSARVPRIFAVVKAIDEYKWVTPTFAVVKAIDECQWDNKHIRFMWIPYEDAVVVVSSNPLQQGEDEEAILKSVPSVPEKVAPAAKKDAEEMNFAQLRDQLLADAPLDQ